MGWTESGFFMVLVSVFGDTKPIFNEESSREYLRAISEPYSESTSEHERHPQGLDNDITFFV